MQAEQLVLFKRGRGRPRLYANNAARQRHYRRELAAWRRQHGKAWQTRHDTKAYHLSTTTEWETPQPFFDALHTEFGFTLDVAAQAGNAKCARYFTPEEDGRAQSWEGVCWLNPPYGKTIGDWIAKAYTSAQEGATVVCLVPVRTDTRWWQCYCQPPAEIRFVPGRLTFGGATNPAPFPNAVVIFRPSCAAGSQAAD